MPVRALVVLAVVPLPAVPQEPDDPDTIVIPSVWLPGELPNPLDDPPVPIWIPDVVWPPDDGPIIIPPIHFPEDWQPDFPSPIPWPVEIPSPFGPELELEIFPPVFEVPLDPISFPPAPFRLRLVARVEGSERVELSRDGARWTSLGSAPPSGAVLLGERAWTPATNELWAEALLPDDADLASARVEVLAGRDQVALEVVGDRLVLRIVDTPAGSDLYELEIVVDRRVACASELVVAARIDGSDELWLSPDGARWVHRFGEWPEGPVCIGGRSWTPTAESPDLPADAETPLLPAGVDLSTARAVSRSGRDLVALEVRGDSLIVRFADEPAGADEYRIAIRFGD